METQVLIVAAMEREVSAFRRGCMSLPDEDRQESVRLHVTGVGKERAIRETAALLEGPSRPHMVLAVGFCGALVEELHTGDLVVSRSLYTADSDTPIEPGSMLGLVQEALEDAALRRFHIADVLTVPGALLGTGDKARLARKTGAWAVNMEDYWIGNVARESGVPFLSVRAVLDTADQTLPPFVANLGEKGLALQVTRVIAGCAAGPWHIPGVLKLSKQVRAAQESLAAFGLFFVKKIQVAGAQALS